MTGKAACRFRQARERIELLLLWMNPKRGLAGERRRKRFPADGNNKAVTLTFTAFGQNTATLFHAAQYKPSLTNGLRFLDQSAETQFKCSDPWGLDLARAFDAAIREDTRGYKWLRQLNKLQARRSGLTRLAGALDVNTPSPREQQAFLASFFPKECPSDAEFDAERWKALQLMLRAVHAVCQSKQDGGGRNEATVSEIRSCMARGLAPGGTVSVVNGDSKGAHATWAVLQLWHLQRLCLETLSYLVERWLAAHATGGDLLTAQVCAEALARNAERFHKPRTGTARVDHTVAHFHALKKKHPSLYVAAARFGADSIAARHDIDVWSHIQRFDDAAKTKVPFEDDEGGEAVARIYVGLVFCAVETGNLLRQGGAISDVLKEVDDTCSLIQLGQLVEEWKDKRIADFMAHVVTKWVIHRHFEVAAKRSAQADNKGRFRYVDGDYGLESTRDDPNLPAVTADRLEQALLLCEQAGLLAAGRDAGTYKLTQAGRGRLKGAAAQARAD